MHAVLRTLVISGALSAVAGLNTSCASGNDENANTEIQNSDNQSAAEFQGQQNASTDDKGEAVNNATEGDDTQAESNPPLTNNPVAQGNSTSGGNSANNPLANGGEGVNNAVDSDAELFAAQAGQSNTAAPMNQPAVDPAVNAVVDQVASPLPENTAQAPVAAVPQDLPAPAVASSPQTGGVVLYAREDGVGVYDRAGGGSMISSLEQGDHPLVFSEGEWARTQDGHYIPNNTLSDKGVARLRKAAAWQ